MEQQLNSEVLRVLSSQNAIWTRCCGSNGNEGVEFNILLTLLQNRFPASVWDTELLETILRLSLREGRVKQNPQNVWFLYDAMILVNFTNRRYRNTSTAICVPVGCGGCGNTCKPSLQNFVAI